MQEMFSCYISNFTKTSSLQTCICLEFGIVIARGISGARLRITLFATLATNLSSTGGMSVILILWDFFSYSYLGEKMTSNCTRYSKSNYELFF